MQMLRADAVVCGYIYDAIRRFPGMTADEIALDYYDADTVRDALYGLAVSGVIVDEDGHFTAAIIRKRR
jgi:hypothetical protein